VIAIKEGEKQVIDFELTKIGVPQATMTGKIADADSLTPVMATLSFVGTTIKPTVPEPTTGIYKVLVPPGTYSIKVDAEGYLPQSAPVVLADGETKILNFSLKRIARPKVGEKIALRGIYFDFNSAIIKPMSYPVLDDAAKTLLAYPKMRIEISGHTDSIGSDSYNQRLSQMRAESVRNYLVQTHGIDPSRIIAIGYGESMPIADNRSRAGRDQNRRIEYKVLSIE
jgi:outer membrane protein OmpA-like peptidoglycan-associated protein